MPEMPAVCKAWCGQHSLGKYWEECGDHTDSQEDDDDNGERAFHS